MKMEEINTGEVVSLKSGGPSMTVRFANDTDIRACWFSADGKLSEGVFSPEMLSPVIGGGQ